MDDRHPRPRPLARRVASACADVRDAEPSRPRRRRASRRWSPVPPTPTRSPRCMRAAAAHGLTVVPRGRGTKLSWGAAADQRRRAARRQRARPGARPRRRRPDRRRPRPAPALADLQEVVGAGRPAARARRDRPRRHASAARWPPTPAVPAASPTGTARDLLIGITVVRADGVVAKAGGRVVKNVAGYDLGKLMIGSFGTLAVVTEAVFRLHPVPDAPPLGQRPGRRPGRGPDGGPVGRCTPRPCPRRSRSSGPRTGGGAVHVLLEGREDGVDGRAGDRPRAARRRRRPSPQDDPAGGATYPWDTAATGDDRATALKLTFALSGLADVLTAARDIGAARAWLRRRRRGVRRARRPARRSTSVRDGRRPAPRDLRPAGGSAVVVDAPAAVKAAVDVWGPVPALDLMRRVKDQFDPDHRLAPGRFVGGI